MKLSSPIYSLIFAAALSACSGGGGGDDAPIGTDSCSVLGLQSRIINGTECTSANSSVVQIVLIFNDGSLGSCSGSMITSRDVLSAGHCFPSRVRGAFVTANGARVDGASFSRHPDYQETPGAIFNDVAVLRLSSAVNLPTLGIVAGRDVKNGDLIDIFGFGESEGDPGDSSTSGTLRSGQMRIEDVTQNHLASSFDGSGSNTCAGDSGGPALLQYGSESGARVGIVGITSTGVKRDCGEGDVSLFTNVQSDSVLNFIVGAAPQVEVL
ncbi:MAG: hypothetical protein DCC75_08040 [Proteobacteria bacterium]|nr:MAG: hypothetical protein DCC75_08040 [Pseudomonadota bacterium]